MIFLRVEILVILIDNLLVELLELVVDDCIWVIGYFLVIVMGIEDYLRVLNFYYGIVNLSIF